MVLGFIKCLGAGDRATFDIGLTRSVERRGSVQIGLALGILHSIGRRLMMKQPPNGLWAVGPLSKLDAACWICRSSCAMCKVHGPLCAALPPRSTPAPVVAMTRPT